MATQALLHIQDEAKKLSRDEQLQLAEYLIKLARQKKYVAKTVDLNRFAGTVKLKEDPMEYQKRVRAEWP